MGMFRPAWFRQLIAGPYAVTTTACGFRESHGQRVRPPVRVSPGLAPAPVLLAYATQTGAAEAFAYETRRQLQAAGARVRMVGFDALDVPLLEASCQALFVASTTYDGDPPEMAETFSRNAMGRPARLSHLRYGLLALGDRAYDDFCGFGHRVDAWLRASGAQAWFDPIEVDDEDARALDCWHGRIALLAQARRTRVP